MNKEIFLEELRRCLQILEDQEQEDILEEYAQHIDIKVQKGQSEEEAIRDFGSVKELAAEILEAYHVKPEYQGGKGQSRLPELSRVKIVDGKRLFQRAGGFLKEKSGACVRGMGNGFRWIGAKCRVFALWMAGLFSRKKEQKILEEEKRGEEGMILESAAEKMTGAQGGAVSGISGNLERERMVHRQIPEGGVQKGRFWRTLGHGIVICWKTFVNICLWWLRLFWNLAWLLFSVFCGILAAMMLAGAGGTVVLLFQGYPFVGVLLLALGGLLCFGALSCGAFSLMIRKEKRELEDEKEEEEKANVETGKEETEESQEEVQHEETT